ncbi:CbtA family protein [Roseomonas sp. KE0001]|uniref:CbtA family protein n=1 Tax=Roseomonas sp. KE0001 TaxID=2479201 RepID=UPI0018E05CBD|nr:CbtA family protein [Roseomonas sp. KE0001]MBI0433470.1 cobalt transporter [Roseomonas sp. KE0001]
MMDHLRRLLAVALFAGILAGAVASLGHQWNTVPTILVAETYEHQDSAAPGQADHAAEAHEHGAEAWAPEDGLERTLYTVLADMLTGIAYALLLGAAMSLRGAVADWRQGLLWGLAGFAVFTLAPSIGLPPKLPGTPVAELADRQVWWVATALLTAGGLALIAFTRRLPWAVLAVIVIALPHLWGAPAAPAEASAVPDALTQRFIAGVTAVSLLFWATLGLATGWLQARLSHASHG